jgi:opacity protein-like surface antigen
MKRILFLLLAVSLLSNCSGSSDRVRQANTSGTPAKVEQNPANANVDYGRGSRNYEELMKQQQTQHPGNETPAVQPVPAAFKDVDFGNFDYPEVGEKFTIRLRNGKYKWQSSRYAQWREYESGTVDYVDLTGDRRRDALVNVSDLAGSGSSGVFEIFYLYSMSNGKPRLLWSFETGAQSQCGHQTSSINDSKLTIEVIGNCSFRNKRLFNEDTAADIEAYHLTRFVFGWKDSKFQQLGREVIPLP